ncbi:MAG: PepSY-associated TM helix domain-containing protein [Bacteroidota bacterium]
MSNTKKNKRNYNVFFNTHTVTGITISVALFVCFFAGAFALFMENINRWEANEKGVENQKQADVEAVLATLESKGYALEGRTFIIDFYAREAPGILVRSAPITLEQDSTATATNVAKDSLANANINLELDTNTLTVPSEETMGRDGKLGDFLYHLHYFQQIPAIGIVLSSLVALFFLFAIVTGTIVHWRKIVSNFFTFRLKSSLKNLWTDAHTALGIIGLPFQFMYALTGAFYGLIIVALLPYALVYFGGDFNQIGGYIAPSFGTIEKSGKILEDHMSINGLIDETLAYWENPSTERIRIKIDHYKDRNAQLMVDAWIDAPKNFFNEAIRTYRLLDGEVVYDKPLNTNFYGVSTGNVMAKLHFANYGGYFIRLVYFVLALITCFVILSGVMVWLEARNTKKYEYKKGFNTNVGAIYLGASLGLFPTIALFFCMTKLFPMEMEGRFGTMSTVFFLFWLGYTIYAFFLKDFHKINKHALLLAGVLGLFIPVLNGIQSGLWPWVSLSQGYIDSFFVDVSWLVIGAISLWVGIKTKRLVAHKKKKILELKKQTIEVSR